MMVVLMIVMVVVATWVKVLPVVNVPVLAVVSLPMVDAVVLVLGSFQAQLKKERASGLWSLGENHDI